MNRVDWDVFPYASNVDYDKFLFDALGDTCFDVKNTLKTFRKNGIDKIIFAHLHINAIETNLIS